MLTDGHVPEGDLQTEQSLEDVRHDRFELGLRPTLGEVVQSTGLSDALEDLHVGRELRRAP